VHLRLDAQVEAVLRPEARSVTRRRALRGQAISIAAVSIAAFGLACPAPSAPIATPTSTVTITRPAVDAPPIDSQAALAPARPALRLARNFLPIGYTARLAIDPAKPTFDGAITIDGTVSERSSVLWLHGRDLQITRAAASQGDPFASPRGISAALTVTPRGEDLLEIHADPPLEPGPWQLVFEYTGVLDDVNTTGAFRQTVHGASYVFSQFEAIYARRVFPCFDEPDVKVPWQLTLDVPDGQLAVANTAATSDTALGDGRHRVVFAPTKPLPSYLIAFGVGPFDVVPAGATKRGTPVRIVTLNGRAADAAYAVKTTARLVDLLEDWFGIPYPYDKLDMLTVPLTVGFGAMENAGLITFAESEMLIDPKRGSWQRRHSWITVAAHELAHQWFGDYVTTAWWDDIWLNEGFANWMENKIAVKFDPTWHDEQSELEMRLSALDSDSVISARQIREPIEAPGDILNVFDGITYNKGASVLNMFESHVGAEPFQRGVRAYLSARAFSSATSADFVAAISAAAGHDVAPAFSTFLDQGGAPEISATIACGGGSPHVDLVQRRYVPAGSLPPPPGKPWIAPICVAYEHAGARAEACGVLDQPTGSIALPTKACPRWVMPNVNGRGYYRSALSASQVIALRDEAWPLLSWSERRAMFDDIAEAARTGTRVPGSTPLPFTLALSLVPKLLAGGDRFTIGEALGLPLGIDTLVGDDVRAKYEAWLRVTFGPGAAKVGLAPKDADDLDAERVRAAVTYAAAWTGRDPDLVKQATDLAANWRDLPVAIRGLALQIAVDASPERFTKALAEVRTEPDRIRRGELYAALGSVRDVTRLTAALQLTLDPALDIRESMYVLFAPSNDAARRVVEAFFRQHQAALMQRIPHDEVSGSLFAVNAIFTGGCDAARRDEVASYVTASFAALPGGDRVVKQSIEAMDQCIARRALLTPQLRGWLAGFKPPKPKPAEPIRTSRSRRP
jgi:alanyl aminopeptidase